MSEANPEGPRDYASDSTPSRSRALVLGVSTFAALGVWIGLAMLASWLFGGDQDAVKLSFVLAQGLAFIVSTAAGGALVWVAGAGSLIRRDAHLVAGLAATFGWLLAFLGTHGDTSVTALLIWALVFFLLLLLGVIGATIGFEIARHRAFKTGAAGAASEAEPNVASGPENPSE